jgi:uncharacterized membrane protein YphA (DoxX/SURF4 family)
MSDGKDKADPKKIQSAVVGVRPWLPWPLSRSRWWNEPVAAERLAVLRIGLAALLLLDILCTYLPVASAFFGPNSLGRPEIFEYLYKPYWNRATVREDLANLSTDLSQGDPFHRTLERRWRWSLLYGVEDARIIYAALIAWLVAAACLLLGLGTRLAAIGVWLLSTSFANINSYLDNAGDQVRYILTLYLMLTPCGAAWSLDAWLRRRRGKLLGRVMVYPWALRLLFVQMVLVYWCNGIYKATGSDWPSGDSLYYVLGDLQLTRWSYAQFPAPYLFTKLLSWTVLVWEVTFPLWVCLPWRWLGDQLAGNGGTSRRLLAGLVHNVPVYALLFGVAFHLGIGFSMELGFFVPYMLCLYLPLLPFERLFARRSHVSFAVMGASTRT